MPIGDLVVRIVGDNSQFDSALNQSERRFKTFSDSMQKFGRSMTVFVTAPLVAAGVAAVKSAGEMEMYQASFETMLGSAEKAKVLLEDMRKFAAQTPFSMTDLADASKTLLQFGINGDEVLDVMKMLGDAAQGNGQRFSQLALVYGQISSTGRLMGQDLLQLINAGFNPLQVIAEKTGKSMGELKDAMSKGQISAQQITEAFRIATSQGGMFFGGMQKASQTLPGLMSTLGDDIATLGRSFAEILLPAIKDIIKSISGFVQNFTALDDSTKKAILTFAGIAAAAGPAILAIKAIGTAFTTSAGPIGLVVAGIAALTAGIILMIEKTKQFRAEDADIQKAMKGQLGTADEYKNVLIVLGNRLDDVNAKLKENKASNQLGAISADTNHKMNQQIADDLKKEINLITVKMSEKVRAEEKEKKALEEKMVVEAEANLRRQQATIAQMAEEQKRKDALDAMHKTLEENSLSEAELIEKEIAQLRKWGATDAEVMDYMKLKHKEFYEKETENIDKLKEEQAAATQWAIDFDAQERAAIEKNLDEMDKIKQDLHEKELARIEAEREAYVNVSLAMFASLSGLLNDYTQYKLSLYDKDSEEYKAAALEQFNIQKGLSAVNAGIAGAEAAVNAYKALAGIPIVGPFLGLAAAIAIGGFTAAQVGFILAQEPPAMAEGGIAPPVPGGRQYTLGEAGQYEAVIPLDRLDDMLDSQGMGGGGQTIKASFYLDRRLIFEDFYNLTKNREVLVDGGAIVGRFEVQ